MGAVRIVVLAVALVAAIGLALMVRGMATPKKEPVVVAPVAAPAKPTARVLVAKRDLGVGERISSGDVGWQDWPADAINPAYITDGSSPPPPAPVKAADKDTAKGKDGPKDNKQKQATSAVAGMISNLSGAGAVTAVNGAVVREPILSGEPVVERKIVRDGEGGFMSVVLQPGMRAMALPVTVETGVGGFILPGDRVDVLQSKRIDKAGGGGQEVVGRLVMRNLRVLAIDQTTEPEKNAKSVVGATATLEVAAADAPRLAKAKTQGDLMLALRSYADAGGPSGAVGGDEDSEKIKVYRAGQVSEVMASQ